MGKGRVAVIGGGISGMAAAWGAKRAGADVMVFDTNQSLGKKLTRTGNGKCNFANEDQALSHYHSESPEYIKSVFSKVPLEGVLEFFKECGVEPKNEKGLYYPYSMQAKSVRDCMLLELEILGVNICTDTKVTGVVADGSRFIIESPLGTKDYDGVILACGGMAAPESGSDGNGFVLAKDLGHSIIRPLPALCPMVTDDHFIIKAAGVRTDCCILLNIDGKKYRETGNLQITEYGISGICTMQLSTYVSYGLLKGSDILCQLDFLPDKKRNEAASMIEARFTKNGRSKSSATALMGLLPDKLAVAVLKKSGIKPEGAAVNVTKEGLKTLTDNIKSYPIHITDTRGFSQAQTTLGGVNLKELDKKSLESKLKKGLYFCGEILDVCGDCGGYNIQWAISSGIVAGKACGEGL